MAGKTALIVDDSIAMRRYVRVILDAAGFDCREAADGEEALIELARQPVDLVVADVDMPRLDGLALIGALASARGNSLIPVLIACSSAMDDILERHRSRLSACAACIQKPFQPRDLLIAIRSLRDA